jgi:multidrug transporter EmrE-like cation transporter
VLVLALTAISGWLGPQLSGLLAPFPIITTVLATFTHAQRGSDELLRLLRGLVGGFGAFALFCVTLSLALRGFDTGVAFALATGVALLTQAIVLALVGASRGAHHRPEPLPGTYPRPEPLPEYYVSETP